MDNAKSGIWTACVEFCVDSYMVDLCRNWAGSYRLWREFSSPERFINLSFNNR